MAIAVGFFAPQGFQVVGVFPGFIAGVPYDEQLALEGAYFVPLAADAPVGVPPHGLTLEISGDGVHLRLHGTPSPPVKITGVLPGFLSGVPYSATLQVEDLSGETVAAYDVIDGAVPAWMTVSFDSGTNTLTFSGTPT